jgi:hypothetical protein
MKANLWGCLWLACMASAANADGGHDGDGKELELTITGHISPKCEIRLPNRALNVQLFDRAGSDQLGFALDCNQVMNVTLVSQNGGLEHDTHARGEAFDGFLNFLPYTATFSVNANGAQAISASSEAMRGGAGGSVGVVPHGTTGTLELGWNPELPLVGGTYQDVIEIRVTGAGEDEIPRL